MELAQRVTASDVGDETISRLEAAFDDLAVAYSTSPPQELIERIRVHLSYVKKLMDGRKTLHEHRYRQAMKLAQAAQAVAQAVAPAGSSALTQATAQEGRAWARLHQGHETYGAMDRVRTLAGSLPDHERPGHHYRYDPDKVTAYSATTLAWLGDPAAETYARELLTTRFDEAAKTAQSAISSGHIAPSNYWRALEVVTAVEAHGLPETTELREACESLRSTRR